MHVYLGTSKESNFKKEIIDMSNSSDFNGLFDTQNVSLNPYSEAHGIVWKVLVNGKDAQDEYDLMYSVHLLIV